MTKVLLLLIMNVLAFPAMAYLTPLNYSNATQLQGTNISTIVPSDAQCLVYSSMDAKWEPASCESGSGVVTSVGLVMPNIFTVTGTPVTSAGTLTAALAPQTVNKVWAAPSTGTGAPVFRTLIASDIPSLSYIASISTSDPLSMTGGSTPTLTIATATAVQSGFVTSTDWSTFNSKEPAISSGTTLQYWRGDKTFQTLDTSVVPENGNQYFTVGRAQGASSATAPITYSGGVIACNVASGSQDGCVSSTSFNTFNNKESALSFSSPLSRSVNTISIPVADTMTSGYISSSDWNFFNNKQSGLSFVAPIVNTAGAISMATSSAVNSGFLLAADWSTFNAKQSALTFTSPIVNTAGTVAMAQATGSVSGYLSNTDWTTFNGKQSTLTTGNLTSSDFTVSGGSGAVIGSGVTLNINSSIPPTKGGTGTTTTFTQGSVVFASLSGNYGQDNSNFFYDSSNHSLGIGNASPGSTFKLNVSGPELISTASTQALVVGPNGVTSPTLVVDSSVASAVTGVDILSAASGGGVTLSAISSATNEGITIQSKGNGSVVVNNPSINGTITVRTASGARLSISGPTFAWTPTTLATAATVRMSYVGAADTTLTASTEAPNWYLNLGQIRQHSTGALALQRDFRITPSTHSFVGASTLTDAAALSIDGPPVGGTNATITNAHGLYIPTSSVANTTNSFGLTVNAASGATRNYSAQFIGTMLVNGHQNFTGTSPAVSSGVLDCGTTPSIVGNDNVGRVTVGSSTNGGACTITFASSWTNAPICMVEDETTNILVRATSVGASSFQISGVLVAGDSLTYRCSGYQ